MCRIRFTHLPNIAVKSNIIARFYTRKHEANQSDTSKRETPNKLTFLLLGCPFLLVLPSTLKRSPHHHHQDTPSASIADSPQHHISYCIALHLTPHLLRIHRDLSNQLSAAIMALQTAYKQFLAAPNSSFLANDASIHYITTLVTVNGSSDVIKHLTSQSYELKKNEQTFLDVVEGTNSLAVEVHTTLEFLSGGGSYLPGLDDNFLADRIVTFPIVCMSSSTREQRADFRRSTS